MKMFKYLLVLCTIFVFACSDDFLEMNPSTNLGDNTVINNVDDFEKASWGAYNDLTSSTIYDGHVMLWGDLASEDWMNPGWSSNWCKNLYDYERSKIAAPTAIFQKVYSSINHINNVLMKGAALEADENPKYKRIVSELRVIRALLHFELVKLYGPLPTTLGKGTIKADALGIYISDKVFEDPYAEFYRGKVSDNYTWIIKELEESIADLPNVKVNAYLNAWAAKGLLARVSLYAGNYQKALGAAQDIIANSPYQLYERDYYVTAWTEEFTSESMFELKFSKEDNNDWNCLGYYTRGNTAETNVGYKEVMATVDFVAFMQGREDDVRLQLVFFDDIDKDGVFELTNKEGYYPSGKYPGRDGQFKINNPKVIRLSEIYLIAAECHLKPGGTPLQAAVLLNTLRGKRISNYQPVSEVTIDDILTERRLELFAEGHRSYDLRRNLKDIVRYTSAAEKAEKYHDDDLEGLPAGVIPFDYYKHLLPLTEREINLLSPEVIEREQNPGY